MKRILLAVSAIAVAAAAVPASAANYIFDVTYNGNNSGQLASGSADPTKTTLNAGDTLTYTLSAFGNSYWNTNGGGNSAFMAALFGGFGQNSSTYRIDFLNDGASVFSTSGTTSSCCAHMGPYGFTIGSGLTFDQTRIALTVNTIASPAPMYGLLPISGAPERALSFISFTPLAATAAVPEPATWAMLMLGFGGMGFAMRRRRSVETRIRFA